MIKILKNLTVKEWILAALSLGLIVLQVCLDLTLPEYMGKITELSRRPAAGWLKFYSPAAECCSSP